MTNFSTDTSNSERNRIDRQCPILGGITVIIIIITISTACWYRRIMSHTHNLLPSVFYTRIQYIHENRWAIIIILTSTRQCVVPSGHCVLNILTCLVDSGGGDVFSDCNRFVLFTSLRVNTVWYAAVETWNEKKKTKWKNRIHTHASVQHRRNMISSTRFFVLRDEAVYGRYEIITIIISHASAGTHTLRAYLPTRRATSVLIFFFIAILFYVNCGIATEDFSTFSTKSHIKTNVTNEKRGLRPT